MSTDRERGGNCVATGEAHSRMSWCGRKISSSEWQFVDPTHALLSLRQGSLVPMCHDCVRAMRLVLNQELGVQE